MKLTERIAEDGQHIITYETTKFDNFWWSYGDEIIICSVVYVFFLILTIFIVKTDNKIVHFIRWMIYDLSGIRFIFEKIYIKSNSDKNTKPSVFIFWIVGLYTAIYGIAYQKYDHIMDRIDQRSNAIVAQLSENNCKPLELVSNIVNFPTPCQPFYFHPDTVFDSLISNNCHYEGVKYFLYEVIKNNRDCLTNLYLKNIDFFWNYPKSNFSYSTIDRCNFDRSVLCDSNFSNTRLLGASFDYSILTNSSFKNATVRKYNLKDNIERDQAERTAITKYHGIYIFPADCPSFKGAILENVDFENVDFGGLFYDRVGVYGQTDFSRANLKNANFKNAILIESIFSKSYLAGTVFENALCIGADFQEAEKLTCDQLCSTMSIYDAKNLNEDLLDCVKQRCSNVLDKPMFVD